MIVFGESLRPVQSLTRAPYIQILGMVRRDPRGFSDFPHDIRPCNWNIRKLGQQMVSPPSVADGEDPLASFNKIVSAIDPRGGPDLRQFGICPHPFRALIETAGALEIVDIVRPSLAIQINALPDRRPPKRQRPRAARLASLQNPQPLSF